MAGAVEILTTIADVLPAVVSLLDLFHDSAKKRKEKQQPKVLPAIYINGQTGQPIYYPQQQVGGAAKKRQKKALISRIINSKRRKIDKPPQREDVRTAMQYYDKLTPQMKEELSEYLPEPIINHLETVYKIFKESPLPPAEKEKALLRYTQKLHSLDSYLLDPMLDTLGVKPTGQTESPYVWVQRLTPDGRVKWEFKRRDEVMGYNPLPEAKEDLAAKMARENQLTGIELYKALPDLYREELVQGLAEEEIKRLEEERKKALRQYKEEARGRELEAPNDEEERSVSPSPPPPFEDIDFPSERDKEKKEEKQESEQIGQEVTGMREPLVQSILEDPEEQRRIEERKFEEMEKSLLEGLSPEEQKITQLNQQAYKDLLNLLGTYPNVMGPGRVTKKEAATIFELLEGIVINYINPAISQSYMNKRRKEFEDLMSTRTDYIKKREFQKLVEKTIDNIFIDKKRIKPDLLK